MGELSFCFHLRILLEVLKIPVFVSTTERKSVEIMLSDGSIKKEAVFQFVRFR